MKQSFYSCLLIVGYTLLCSAQGTGQPPGIEDVEDSALTKRILKYWADFACFTFSDGSEPNVKEQCKEACFPGGVISDVPPEQIVQSSQTCWLNGPESWFLTGKPLTEEEKTQQPRTSRTVTPGYCSCDDPIINFAGEFLLKSISEMGQSLQKIMCPVLTALDLVVEIGSAAIPGVGKAITLGMRTGVRTAKMFQYAYDAQEAALEWASMFVDQGFGLASEAGCKTPFTFSKADLAKRFLDFANAPDQLVPGIDYEKMPCPKGKKASKRCKERNGEDQNDEPTATTENTNQPTPTDDNSKPSQASTQSFSSSSEALSSSTAMPQPTVDCDAIGRYDLGEGSDENESEDMERRETRNSLHGRRLSKRRYKPKVANVCSVDFPSLKYPSSGERFMTGKLAYGFNVINDCSDYAWGVQTTFNTRDYDTEHVLEWSMVKNFFNVMNKELKPEFEHPNPNERIMIPDPQNPNGPQISKKVEFCTYWNNTWAWKDKETMPDPSAPAPVQGPGPNVLQQTPFQWFAEAYPFVDGGKANSRRAHDAEFVLLQRKINSQPKNCMFSVNPNCAVYNDKAMNDLMQGKNTDLKGQALAYGEPHEQPRVALQRLRTVVGAYLYLKEDHINGIFIAQVDRIGARLELMEQALAKISRPIDEVDKKTGNKVIMDKWVPQKLREKWFKYMDDVYNTANNKGLKFMEVNIKRLKAEFNDAKKISQADVDKEKTADGKKKKAAEKDLRDKMPDYIAKLEAAWIKAKDWPKPKWNVQNTPTSSPSAVLSSTLPTPSSLTPLATPSSLPPLATTSNTPIVKLARRGRGTAL